ncbi:HAD hydrolase family protein [Actinoplanes sp. NPDC049316]|uniref:HAD hydrolase family protein n=1 Tax=Actinoplanes sp. NPDC049316 TaxID=3154727 RepID=UPI00342E1573
MRWYRAVAMDLDGTLTLGGWPSEAVLGAVDGLRADGVRTLLVTGRILADLDVEFPGLADRFDLVVGENGGVLRSSGWTRPLADPVDPNLLERLHDAGVRARRGEVLLACDGSADHLALDAIESLGLDVQLVRNRAALMLIPSGVTKGTGMREGLAELGVSPHNTLAVGDAENDHSMLTAAGLGVAVANAVAGLRDHADLVLAESDGAGVSALLTGPVLTGQRPVRTLRRRIVLGTGVDQQPAVLPAAQTNLMVTGASESGKSYLAGLVVEQLAALGYVLLVIDPEGDHVSLGALRGVTVLAGNQLPDPAEVPTLYGQGLSCLILDLSSLHRPGREDYLRRMWPAVAAYRAETALPHWIVLEEAQNLGWCHHAGLDTPDLGEWGLCLVSYQPDRIAAPVLDRMRWRVELSPGGHSAILTPPDGPPMPITIGRRTTPHVRHWHKYVDSPLPDHERFAFHTAPGGPAPVAANLREFLTLLPDLPDEVITFHARRHDFSRWLAGVYRDHVLASLIATCEQDLVAHGDPRRTRRLLAELVTVRYLPPERTTAAVTRASPIRTGEE